MSDRLRQSPQIIPAKEWDTPERRAKLEARFRTSLGAHGFEFDDSQYDYLLGAHMVGKGVLWQMTRDFGSSGVPEFSINYDANFDKPGGTFSGGTLFFGAATRLLAERYQQDFLSEANNTLDSVGAEFRLVTSQTV